MCGDGLVKKENRTTKIINISTDNEQQLFHQYLIDEFGHGSISKFIRNLEKKSKRYKHWKKRLE